MAWREDCQFCQHRQSYMYDLTASDLVSVCQFSQKNSRANTQEMSSVSDTLIDEE